MTEQTISKNGIVFLRPNVLLSTIRKIELRLPGWWWSISQRPLSLTLSVAPTKNSPLAHDVVFSKTRFGDTGFINEFYYVDASAESYFFGWLENIFSTMDIHRSVVPMGHDFTSVEMQPTYRKQSLDDLDVLGKRYTEFLKTLDEIELSQWHLNEFYLGSCEFSVDCSLRGNKAFLPKDAADTTFDCTADLPEPGQNLANSLSEALLGLKFCILNPDIEDDPDVEIPDDVLQQSWSDHVARLTTQP